MSQRDQEAMVMLRKMIDRGYTIQTNWNLEMYEITVWKNIDRPMEHRHYSSDSLIKAIMISYEKTFEIWEKNDSE